MDTKDIKDEAAKRDEALDKTADIPAATSFAPSGAPNQVTDFDVDHPAVDANPREGTTIRQNKIDFNDPTISGAEAVARNLGLKPAKD